MIYMYVKLRVQHHQGCVSINSHIIFLGFQTYIYSLNTYVYTSSLENGTNVHPHLLGGFERVNWIVVADEWDFIKDKKIFYKN